jgi:hypothetical protein
MNVTGIPTFHDANKGSICTLVLQEMMRLAPIKTEEGTIITKVIFLSI